MAKRPAWKGYGNVKKIGKAITSFEQSNLLIAVIIICVVIGSLTPVFFSGGNIMNLLRQASMAGIAGLGMTLIMLTGEVDLSIGSAQAMIGVFVVTVINATNSIFLGIVCGIGLGVAMGVFHATLVTKFQLESLIVTLATLSVYRGTVMVLTSASSIPANNPNFELIGTGYVGPVPIPVIMLVALCALIYFITRHTTFGRNLYAVGSNREAAKLAGINVSMYKYRAFIMNGMFVALAAIILASRINSGQPQAGVGFELAVISAVILGGVSLAGGRGTIAGMILGVMILSILDNGLVLLNVSSFYQQIVRGIVLILAVYFDQRRKVSFQKKVLEEKQ